MRIIARINLWYVKQLKTIRNWLVAFVTCLARRWKCLTFPSEVSHAVPNIAEPGHRAFSQAAAVARQPHVSQRYVPGEREIQRLAIKIKCRANSARWRTLGLNVRDWLRFVRELWRLSNPRLIPIARLYLRNNSCRIVHWGSQSPFYFSLRNSGPLSMSVKKQFSPQSPITLYQNRHNGPFDLCWWFFLLHLSAITTIFESSSQTKKNDSPITIYERWTWIIALAGARDIQFIQFYFQ